VRAVRVPDFCATASISLIITVPYGVQVADTTASNVASPLLSQRLDEHPAQAQYASQTSCCWEATSSDKNSSGRARHKVCTRI
jgi:hypothetical protein